MHSLTEEIEMVFIYPSTTLELHQRKRTHLAMLSIYTPSRITILNQVYNLLWTIST